MVTCGSGSGRSRERACVGGLAWLRQRRLLARPWPLCRHIAWCGRWGLSRRPIPAAQPFSRPVKQSCSERRRRELTFVTSRPSRAIVSSMRFWLASCSCLMVTARSVWFLLSKLFCWEGQAGQGRQGRRVRRVLGAGHQGRHCGAVLRRSHSVHGLPPAARPPAAVRSHLAAGAAAAAPGVALPAAVAQSQACQ